MAKTFSWVAFGAGWACCVALGMTTLAREAAIAGTAATPPLTHDESELADSTATLVLYIHPRCPCSSATLDELAKLMVRCEGKLAVTVMMVRPPGVETGWEQSDLWRKAAAIPGVKVLADENGAAAQAVAARTSGQAVLYDAQGRLLFSGGITPARGHRGDNAGSAAIVALILPGVGTDTKEPARSPVYGCPLLDSAADVQTKAGEPCRK